MIIEQEYYSELSRYLCAIIACALASLFMWLAFSKTCSRASSNFQNPANYVVWENNVGKENVESMTIETTPEEGAETCTSVSCIRCSKSVYSVEKLLKKCSAIEELLKTDVSTGNRMRNGILNASKRLERCQRSQQEPTLFYLKELPSQVWYNSDVYSSEVSGLESQSTLDVFRKEFLSVYQDSSVGWVSNKVPSGGWHLFYLINQGVKNPENCLKCPRTLKAIERLSLAMLDCAFGNVLFSVLSPGTRIARHCGPTNVRIRCHVPLQTPKGFFISVAGKEQTWEEGKTLIFDDSFYHEVYCRGTRDEPRVVLMMDMWHQSLSLSEREMIKRLFPPQH